MGSLQLPYANEVTFLTNICLIQYCQISYREGLGMSLFIMGLTTKDPHIQKEHTELYKILKFRVDWANIEQYTAIQKLQNLVTNVWIAGHVRKSIHFFANFEVFEYWPNYHEI